MQSWLQAFFTFSRAERAVIDARYGATHKLGLALRMGFLRLSGRSLRAVRVVPVSLWIHLGKALRRAPAGVGLTGDYATIVKLFRVSMLAVVVVVVSSLFKKQREQVDGMQTSAKQPLVSWFLWVIVALVIVNSLGGMPPVLQHGLNDVSRACLITAIAALGMKTSFMRLARAGWRPFMLLLVETLWMGGFVLIAILLRS